VPLWSGPPADSPFFEVNPLAQKISPDDLKAVLGETGEEVTVDEAALQVKPLNLLQLADALPIVERLAVKVGSRGSATQILMKMLLRGGRDFVELLAVATGRDEEWAGRLNPVDAVRLAKKVYEVNLDFFSRNQFELKELLGPVWELAESLIRGAGRALSSASSSTGTGSKKSEGTRSRRSASSSGR